MILATSVRCIQTAAFIFEPMARSDGIITTAKLGISARFWAAVATTAESCANTKIWGLI